MNDDQSGPSTPDVQRYIIVGYARSGTTYLQHLVRGHPDIAFLAGELRVRPFYTEGPRVFSGGFASPNAIAHGHRALFDALTGLDGSAAPRVRGAKTICQSVQSARILIDTLCRHFPEIKILLIQREDLLAQYGSMLKLRSTGVAHSWHRKSGYDGTRPLRINRWLFERYAHVALDTYDELRRLGQTHALLDIAYSRLATDPLAVYREIIDFLGLPHVQPDWVKSEKVLPDPRAYILNYAAMQRVLRRVEQDRSTRRRTPVKAFWLRVWWQLDRTLNWTRYIHLTRDGRRRVAPWNRRADQTGA